MRLDDNLYKPEKIDGYKLDAYEGPVSFRLDPTWSVPPSQIHLLRFYSGKEQYRIYGIYIGDTLTIDRDTIIMYCHGNAKHMDNYWQRQKLLYARGKYGVLQIDYRGYGLSEGKPSESGLIEDVDAALQWLKKRGLQPERLIIYGFSLGSIPATALAVHPLSLSPSKLILEAPIGSIRTMVEDGAILTMAPEFYTDLQTDNIQLIRSCRIPFLLLHGKRDFYLYIETHGAPIYANHPGPKKVFYRVDGADHENLPLAMGFERYAAVIDSFISH